MNPLAWLNPSRWVLYGALVAALLLGIYTLDKSRQAIGYDRAQAEYTAAALKASEAARAKEQELQTKVAKVNHDFQTEKRRRAADAAVNADRLRGLEDALALAAGTDPAPPGGADDPRDAIIHQCAGALVGLDSYAQSLAGTAAGLQAYAREVCMSR